MARKTKIESYYELDSEMSQAGLGRIISQAEDIEMRDNTWAGHRAKRKEVQQRLVEWFNQADRNTKCDLTYHRPAYCMVVAAKQSYLRKERR